MMLLGLSLYADMLRVEKFEADIFTKIDNKSQKVELDLLIEGRDVNTMDFKVYDSLNVVIGSFYVEDLMTSKGKETFKETLKEFAVKKYGIDIDDVFILRFVIKKELRVKEFIDALKKEGCCK